MCAMPSGGGKFNIQLPGLFEAHAMTDDKIDYRRLAELSDEFTELWRRLHAFYLAAVAGFNFVADHVLAEQEKARSFVRGAN